MFYENIIVGEFFDDANRAKSFARCHRRQIVSGHCGKYTKSGCQPYFSHLLYHSASDVPSLVLRQYKIAAEALAIGEKSYKVISHNVAVGKCTHHEVRRIGQQAAESGSVECVRVKILQIIVGLSRKHIAQIQYVVRGEAAISDIGVGVLLQHIIGG